MKIATWNVNSLNVRLPHVLSWLETAAPDVLCLQELKLEDSKFPKAEIEAAGYQVAYMGQKTYNGVAILSRHPLEDITYNLPNLEDEQKRLIAATINGIRIICGYFPNGQSLDSEKYPYKLSWLAALTEWLKGELARHDKLALLGDYNIAPTDADVHDPKAWEGQVLVSPPEREAFFNLIGMGLTDAFRSKHPDAEKAFSWWDYRMQGFRRNLGLRIDHILLTQPLAAVLEDCQIDKEPRKWERPSDHAPVWAIV
ncbi:exodeoxyribonuclease III [Leeia oryzae]|uniref:exodeoxyribonuclease III n=1 Tax=Leeia oryzae TaxID=356662 RepID=UPI0003745C00|nr:exodeoxyribonuclease III [Leeia oryzae]